MIGNHSWSRRRLVGVTALLAVGLSRAVAAASGLDPTEQLRTFKTPPGFEVNLFASEADGVVNPIQMRWDERGRLWVACSRVYPQLEPGQIPNDQIIILEDTNGDGRADKSTVFADGLMIPTGLEIALGKGNACYVGEGTKISLFTDTDGDDRADRREVVLTGFGTGDNHQNINSFRWSPGGELMFSQGLHSFSRVETPWGISSLDHAGLWRYRPREQRLDGFYGGDNQPLNPWGWVFTRWGQPIVVAGNSGGFHFPAPEMIRGWQGGRRDSIWIRSRGRKTTNPEIIESAQFPEEWQGVMFSCGFINNSVWSLKVEQNGSGLKISDHPSLPPILQSSHGNFRPVDVKVGPDGALYVADWYNVIIGHYQVSFRHPDRDKTHGRIWRVTAKGRPALARPRIEGAALPALCELLRSADRWPREQARRVLSGMDSGAVTKALHAWVTTLDPKTADLDFALIQALGVLAAHDSVSPQILDRVLQAETPLARAFGAEVLARWSELLPPNFDVKNKLNALARDADARVRLAAIVAAANVANLDTFPIVMTAAEKPRDVFIDLALRAAITTLKARAGTGFAADAATWKPAWRQLLQELDRPRPIAVANKTAKVASKPIVPVYGRLRASPFTQGSIAAEVLARGNPARGAEIFRRPELTCVACHQVDEKGGKLGPPLDSIGSAQPLEHLIGTVIEPQREVAEGYEGVKLTTKKGDVVIGIIAAGNESQLTVRDPEGNEHTLATADIASREMIGSLMPAGLTDSLSSEDLRDLFAYLTQLGKVK